MRTWLVKIIAAQISRQYYLNCKKQRMAFTKHYQGILVAVLFIVGALAPLAVTASGSLLEGPSMRERHRQWMTRYGRVYKDAFEREKLSDIFKQNVRQIDSFDRANEKPYRLGAGNCGHPQKIKANAVFIYNKPSLPAS